MFNEPNYCYIPDRIWRGEESRLVSFGCPKCGQHDFLSWDRADTETTCRRCGQAFVVPVPVGRDGRIQDNRVWFQCGNVLCCKQIVVWYRQLGEKVRCSGCQHLYVVPMDAAAPPPPPPQVVYVERPVPVSPGLPLSNRICRFCNGPLYGEWANVCPHCTRHQLEG